MYSVNLDCFGTVNGKTLVSSEALECCTKLFFISINTVLMLVYFYIIICYYTNICMFPCIGY